MSFDPAAFILFLAYVAILISILVVRQRLPQQVKPLLPLIVVQASVWAAFYGPVAFLDETSMLDFYRWLSRFGHALNVVLLTLLILFMVRMGQWRER